MQPTVNQLIQAYRALGWNDEASIRADINAGGWGDKWRNYQGMGSGSSSGGNLVGTVTDQIKKALEFDQAAARAAAEQQWSPYYQELLDDYLNSYNVGKSRSEQDLALQQAEYDRQAPLIQNQIGSQAADAGLYQSGQRLRNQQLAQEQLQRQRTATQQAQTRYMEDINTQKAQRERDLARAREQAITGQVETRRQELYGGYG